MTYETGSWLFAAELNLEENESFFGVDADSTSALLMANYAYSEVASVTARISAIDGEIDSGDADITKYTLAHNYALSDNLLLVTEISYADGDLNASINDEDFDADGDVTTVAVELLFTF